MKKKFQREFSQSHMEFNFANKTFDTFSYSIFWCRYFSFAKVTKIKKEIPNYLPSQLPEIESRVTANRKMHIKESILKGKFSFSIS